MVTHKFFVAAVLSAILVICVNGIVAAANQKIAVLISFHEAPFVEALSGFQEYLRKQAVKADYEVYSLNGDAGKAHEAIQEIRKKRADLIFTLGSLAADMSIKEIVDIPIVACLILRPDNLKKSPNATGIVLEFPLEIQFQWLQRFIPHVKTIGVIYNPDENKKKIEAAYKVTQKMGFRLEPQEVFGPQDVPAALQNLSKRADVLWGLPDSFVMTSQMAKHLLLFSFRNRIPFIGLSSTWVKAGALYSLDHDYKDLGEQSGKTALEVLNGITPGSIPPAYPRKIMYSINLNTAQQIKIDISKELINGAHNIF